MEGMLLLTLTSRRCAQKPFSMVTACTATFLSLAYGDFRRLRMPWSRQDGAGVRSTEDCSAISLVALFGDAKPVKGSRPLGKHEIAAAEIVEETNCRREKLCVLLIVSLLLAAPPRNHPNADHNSTGLRQSQLKSRKKVDSLENDWPELLKRFAKDICHAAHPHGCLVHDELLPCASCSTPWPKNLVPKNGLFRYTFL